MSGLRYYGRMAKTVRGNNGGDRNVIYILTHKKSIWKLHLRHKGCVKEVDMTRWLRSKERAIPGTARGITNRKRE